MRVKEVDCQEWPLVPVSPVLDWYRESQSLFSLSDLPELSFVQ